MGSSYLPPPEQNVVNVGDELSQTALDAINAATFPSGSNPFRTINDGGVISAYDNFKVYQAGEVVTLGGLIYVFNSAIGAAGYGPITHPYAWTSMQGLQGPQGDPGPQGSQGDPGPQGDTGASGGIDDAPSDSIPYIRINSNWSPLSSYDQTGGGGGLPLAGGTMDEDADITIPDQDGDQAVKIGKPAGGGLSRVQVGLFTDIFSKSILEYYRIAVENEDESVQIRPNVIEFTGFGAPVYLDATIIRSFALKTGATFTGKVNTTVTATTAPINIGSQPTAPTTTVAGDLWIGANINYKSWDGIAKAVANTNTTNQFTQGQAISVNSASNALRINQIGTGHALVVEDSANPDASALFVTADGALVIGRDPAPGGSTASSDASLNVQTNNKQYAASFRRTGQSPQNDNPIVFINGSGSVSPAVGLHHSNSTLLVQGTASEGSGIKIGGIWTGAALDDPRALINAISIPVAGTGTYDKEISITINSLFYRIPCRQVSSP